MRPSDDARQKTRKADVKDYYELLSIPRTAVAGDIKHAFRREIAQGIAAVKRAGGLEDVFEGRRRA